MTSVRLQGTCRHIICAQYTCSFLNVLNVCSCYDYIVSETYSLINKALYIIIAEL